MRARLAGRSSGPEAGKREGGEVTGNGAGGKGRIGEGIGGGRDEGEGSTSMEEGGAADWVPGIGGTSKSIPAEGTGAGGLDGCRRPHTSSACTKAR